MSNLEKDIRSAALQIFGRQIVAESPVPQPAAVKKVFVQNMIAAAEVNRLTQDWKPTLLSADGELRYRLRVIRGRSRDLYYNNDYARKFVKLVRANVVGPTGFNFQSAVVQPDGTTPDKWANNTIESEWALWGKRGSCTVDGRLSWRELCGVIMETVARDGEVILRKVRNFNNRHRFALQLLEADHLDDTLNREAPGSGNRINMGVEVDQWGRPIAYHMITKHPGDYYAYAYTDSFARVRIPADEIIHLYIQERPEQTRGVPWMATAMGRLNMMGAFEEAAVIAARIGASKMGFYTRSKDAVAGSLPGDEVTDDGERMTEVEPGVFEELPPGFDFKEFNPRFPDAVFEPFRKAILKAISSGLYPVAYTSLGSDVESANYSSIRAEVLEGRDAYSAYQSWLIEHFCEEVFSEFLKFTLLSGVVNLPYSKFDKFNAPRFIPRGWPWVDPLKDENANAAAIQNLTKSRIQICAEQGMDFEDVLRDRQREEQLAKQYGISIVPVVAATASKPEGTASGSGSGAGAGAGGES